MSQPISSSDSTVPAAETEELLSLDAAAQFLGISKPTLYRLIGQEQIKGIKVGRQWRFRRSDLRGYMDREPPPIALPDAATLDGERAFFAEALRQQGRPAPDDASTDALVRGLLSLAIAHGASDIHLEPARADGAEFSLLRFRVDRLLTEIRRFPPRLHEPLVARIKEMAEMDTSERRQPQSGRIPCEDAGREFDIRVATLPTIHGESVSLRILARSGVLLGLDRVGMASDQQDRVREWLRLPTGLVLIAGTAFSGRTTLAYSLLQEIARPEAKTVTLESPVEMQIPYASQVYTGVKSGLTFAAGLRAAYRQDPNALYLSELRDAETVQLAVQVASAGTLVIAVCTADSAAQAVRRLVETGVEPYQLTRCLVGAVATRLARRVCPECRELRPARTPDALRIRELAAEGGYPLPDGATFPQGRGCDRCFGRGVRGRIGVFEAVPFDGPLADALLRGAGVEEMEALAVEAGNRLLPGDGIRKAAEGLIPLEEALRSTGASL